MYLMTGEDRRLLEEYKAIGTPEEIRIRLSSPYPTNDDYAPLPFGEHEELHLGEGLTDDEPMIEDEAWDK